MTLKKKKGRKEEKQREGEKDGVAMISKSDLKATGREIYKTRAHRSPDLHQKYIYIAVQTETWK